MANTNHLPGDSLHNTEQTSSGTQVKGAGLSAYERKILALLFALALVRGLIYAATIPPWQAPDEEFHFAQARLLLDKWSGEVGDETTRLWQRELLDSFRQFHLWDYTRPKPTSRYTRFVRQSLSHGLLALSAAPVRHQEVTLQLYAMRISAVFLNIAIVLIAFLTSRLMFPDDQFMTTLVPLFVAFVPQHTYINASANDTTLAELLASVIILLTLTMLKKGFKWVLAVAVVLLAVLALQAKGTTVSVILMLGFIAFLYFWRSQRIRRWSKVAIALGGLVGSALLLLLLLPGYLRKYIGVSLLSLGSNIQPASGVEPLDVAIGQTFQSFWARLGWMSLKLDDQWYWILLAFSLVGLVGVIKHVISWRLDQSSSSELQHNSTSLMLLAGSALAAMGILLAWFVFGASGTIFRQGRYLYPAFLPIAILLIWGWREWLPAHWRRPAIKYFALCFFLFDSMILLNYVIPFFYPLWRT
jgi:hypothetical protein